VLCTVRARASRKPERRSCLTPSDCARSRPLTGRASKEPRPSQHLRQQVHNCTTDEFGWVSMVRWWPRSSATGYPCPRDRWASPWYQGPGRPRRYAPVGSSCCRGKQAGFDEQARPRPDDGSPTRRPQAPARPTSPDRRDDCAPAQGFGAEPGRHQVRARAFGTACWDVRGSIPDCWRQCGPGCWVVTTGPRTRACRCNIWPACG
jgi:hypothetical protein